MSSPSSPPPSSAGAPGGAYDPATYVARSKLEAEAEAVLSQRRLFLTLVGPTRIGKSWVLRRLLEHPALRGKRGAVVNLAFSRRELKAPEEVVLHEIARRIVGALGADPTWLTEAWALPETAEGKLRTLMDQLVLHEPLVLAFDRVDDLIQGSRGDGFFRVLRGCHRAMSTGSVGSPWSRSQVVVLAQSGSSSGRVSEEFFYYFKNITKSLDVGDFSEAEVVDLASKHAIELDRDDLGLLRRRVGGHPYLLRIVLLAAMHGEPLGAILEAGRIVDGRGVFAEHLDEVRTTLFSSPTLSAAMLYVLREHRVDDDALFVTLERLGLVTRDRERVDCRYEIYRLYLEALYRYR